MNMIEREYLYQLKLKKFIEAIFEFHDIKSYETLCSFITSNVEAINSEFYTLTFCSQMYLSLINDILVFKGVKFEMDEFFNVK